MTVGFGMSIGTVNSVWAAAGDRDQPAVRVRRTAVTFDSAGGARMGTLPRFAPVVTDFADLTRYTEPVVLNGRIWTQADLVAAVIACLLVVDEPAAGPVATYPAVYSDRRLSPLRHALERAGATDVTLMPEAVAAVEWLDAEYGVSENGLTLVYDLGGNTLDVAVVRTEGDRDKRGVLGKPMRSHEYGGRPLGTVLARYARALAPGALPPVSQVVPLDDTTRLRTWTVRNSLRLVRKCVYAAGLTVGDIDRVLLVGGAARPPEVARVLSELGRPLVMSQDPAHTVAIGAALAAARMADPGVHLGRYARGAAVISSAAVASAVAMSAASMLGSGPLGTDGPALEFAPALAGPARNQFRDIRAFESPGVIWSTGADGYGSALPSGFGSGLSAGADGLLSTTAALRLKGAAAQSMSTASATATTGSAHSRGPGTHCGPADRPMATTYANPARFTNPLPFAAPTIGPVSSTIPSISLPTKPTAPSPNPDTTHLPGSSQSNPSGSSPGTDSGTPVSDLGNSTAPRAGLPNNPTGITGGAVPGSAGTNIPGQGSPNNPAPPGNGTGQGTPVGSAGTAQGDVGSGAGSGGAAGTGPVGVGSDVGSGGVGGTGAHGVGSGAGSGGVGGTNPGGVGSGGVGPGGVGGDAGSGGTGDGSVAGGADGGAGQGGVGAGTGQGGGTGAGSGGSTDGAQDDSSQRSVASSGGGTQGSGTSSGGGTSSGNSSSGGGPSNSGTAGGHSSNPGTARSGATSTDHSSTGGVSGRTSNGSKSSSKPGGPTTRGSSGGSHSSSGGGGSRR